VTSADGGASDCIARYGIRRNQEQEIDMTLDEFADTLLENKRLLLQLAHAAFFAQRKMRSQLQSGQMERSRSEYDELMRQFDGIEAPVHAHADDWIDQFARMRELSLPSSGVSTAAGRID
jgi:hypothetical protein